MSLKLDELYKQHPWRSINRFMPYALNKGFSESEVKAYFKEHVMSDKLKPVNKNFYLPIYSKVTGAYQFDTLIQSKRATIPAFLIFININSRKAYAYPMNNKGVNEVLRVLNDFISNQKVKTLSSDQDAAYLSKAVVDLFIKHGIDYRTTEDNNHNKLGVINRFIRTIRDYNKNRDFTTEGMNKAINEYNNSIHSSTGIEPSKFTSKDEEEYIKRMDELTDSITSNKDFILNKGDKVRVILDNDHMTKKRSNLSPECYIIDSMNGRAFNIMSLDKSVATYPRYKLVLCKKGKVAETLNDGKRGIIEKIINYDERTDKYEIIYEGGVHDKIKAKHLRETRPTRLSEIEIEYWKDKTKNIPSSISKYLK